MSVDHKSHIILKVLVILESVLRYTLYTLALQSERHLSRNIALSHYTTQKTFRVYFKCGVIFSLRNTRMKIHNNFKIMNMIFYVFRAAHLA